jgi:large subunit ribosomal protein L25
MAMRAGEVVTASVNLEVEAGVEGIANAVEVLGEASLMPSVITVRASMANSGGEIAASALELPKGMTLVTDAETLVARLAEDS